MRISPILEYSSTTLAIITLIGSCTALFAASIALVHNDIKKVIAYSTMSQLLLARDLYNQTDGCINMNQTICVEFYIMFIIYYYSQVTKTRNGSFNINHYNSNKFKLKERNSKFIIISKLIGTSEAIRLILIYIMYKIYNIIYKLYLFSFYSILNNNLFNNISIINNNLFLCNNLQDIKFVLIGTEANKNSLNNKIKNQSNNDEQMNKFNEWLAGLIDGDGYFLLTKKGYVTFEITMDIRDQEALYEIIHKYGGSIRKISGANAIRYVLKNKNGLKSLIYAVNGLIRNPIRLLQLNKLCNKYNIKLLEPKSLTYNNGWYSGFLDSDGSVFYTDSQQRIQLSVTQKNKYLLEPLINIYGGKVSIVSPKIDAYRHLIYRKKEILNMIDNYFTKYPLRTKKKDRLLLIKDIYEYKKYRKLNVNTLNEYKKWLNLMEKWDKYKD